MSHERTSVIERLHTNQKLLKEQRRDSQIQTREIEREKN